MCGVDNRCPVLLLITCTVQFYMKVPPVFQEKDAYRWAIKETLKTMLAFGWTIERAKEGDAFGTFTCTQRVSQAGQVHVITHNLHSSHKCFFSLFIKQSAICCVSQLSFEGASTFSPKPMDMSSITLSWDQCVSTFSIHTTLAYYNGCVITHIHLNNKITYCM